MRDSRSWILAAGDAGALVAFAVAGLASHEEGLTAAGLARAGGPVLAGWFAAALALGAYSRPRPWKAPAAWALGVAGGVAGRSLVLGHPTGAGLATFLSVTLATTGVLLGAWRLIASRVLRGEARAARP